MSNSKSTIHANLDRDKMFSELWWLNYCFCCGRGLGAVGNPYFANDTKDLCLRQTCQMTGISDPFCGGYAAVCCITEQCQFPAMEGSPTCVCCNKTLAAGKGSPSDWKPALFEHTGSFGDTFWVYYFLCGGWGCSKLGKVFDSGSERPLYAAMAKQLCCKSSVKLVPPVEEGVLCASLDTCLCCWSQCAIPPAAGNPGFKCCKGSSADAKAMKYGAPGQVEMS